MTGDALHTALTSFTNTFWGDSAPGGGLLAEAWSGDPDTEAREPLSVTQHGASEGDMGAATTQPPTSELCGVPAAKRGVLCVQNRKKLRANRGKCPPTRQTTEKNFFLFSAKQNRSGERSPVPAFYT